MSEHRHAPIAYESAGNRARHLPISISMTMMICGTVLVLAPWWFQDQYDFRVMFDSPPRAMFTCLTLLLGGAMIVMSYLHARR